MSVCLHRDTHFDRSLCACGAMHTYCNDCGHVVDNCPYDDSPYDKHKPDPSPSPSSRPDCPYGCSSNDNANTPCPHCDGGPDTRTAREHGYAPGSIMDLEQRWLAEQDHASLRQAIYTKLPIVIAANDLERRKPFLALDALLATVERLERERDEAKDQFWQQFHAWGAATGKNQEIIDGLLVRAEAAEALAERRAKALRPLLTTCREEVDSGRCNAPAEFLLWGKLIPAEGLGPRCYDHAAKHVGHRALGDPAWAILDLRPARTALADGGQENPAP